MPHRKLEQSPMRLARMIGALWVVLAVLGPFSLLYVPGEIVVADDPAATAANLRESSELFRAGMAGEVVIMMVEVAMAVLLYMLLRPVSRIVSLIAAFARLGEAFVIGVTLLASFFALRLVSDAAYLQGFGGQDGDTLTFLFLEGHADGVYIGQIFFGFSLLALGYLVYRAGYLPRILGLLLLIASLGYLSDSLGNLLWSGYTDRFGWVVGVTALVGELPFFLWLLVKGVDLQAWNARVASEVAGQAQVTRLQPVITR